MQDTLVRQQESDVRGSAVNPAEEGAEEVFDTSNQLEYREALIILLVISFGPSYIMPDGFEDSNILPWKTIIILIGALILSTVFNYITLNILNTIAPEIKQNSY